MLLSPSPSVTTDTHSLQESLSNIEGSFTTLLISGNAISTATIKIQSTQPPPVSQPIASSSVRVALESSVTTTLKPGQSATISRSVQHTSQQVHHTSSSARVIEQGITSESTNTPLPFSGQVISSVTSTAQNIPQSARSASSLLGVAIAGWIIAAAVLFLVGGIFVSVMAAYFYKKKRPQQTVLQNFRFENNQVAYNTLHNEICHAPSQTMDEHAIELKQS